MRLQTVESIVRALNDAEVPFIVVDGLAVVAHGYGRHTQDIDLVVSLEPGRIVAAFAALASRAGRGQRVCQRRAPCSLASGQGNDRAVVSQ